MSYGADSYASSSSSSSYRRIFGDSPRFSSRPSASTSGYRSQSLSRATSLGGQHRVRTSARLVEDTLDLSQSAALGSEYKVIRTSEKEQMQGLNDRFAVFIEKVRHLEQHNRTLEAELAALRARTSEPSRLAELYRQELRELRARLEEATGERARVLLERERLEEELEVARARAEEEGRARLGAEHALRDFHKDVDDATVARLELEKRVETLLDEVAFTRKTHQEELAELEMELEAARSKPLETPEATQVDLSAALRDIRGQYESVAAQNLHAAEDWYRGKLAAVSEQASRSGEAARAGREELNELRRQLQTRSVETESLRGAGESLERQMREMEERHNLEILGYQDTVVQLENELRTTKSEMARHLREYQDLLNVKMALDIEISAYRKLLEGEETRISSGISYSSPSLNYSYPTRIYSGSSKPAKKEEKEEPQPKAGKVSIQRETYDEVVEETKVVSGKPVEKSESNEKN